MAVDNCRLHEPLDALHKGAVNDARKRSDGVGLVHQVAGALHVPGDGGGDHDHVVVGQRHQLLDGQVHNLPQTGVLVGEQLGHRNEEPRGLKLSKGLSGSQQVDQLGQQLATLSGVDGRLGKGPQTLLVDGHLVERARLDVVVLFVAES